MDREGRAWRKLVFLFSTPRGLERAGRGMEAGRDKKGQKKLSRGWGGWGKEVGLGLVGSNHPCISTSSVIGT